MISGLLLGMIFSMTWVVHAPEHQWRNIYGFAHQWTV